MERTKAILLRPRLVIGLVCLLLATAFSVLHTESSEVFEKSLRYEGDTPRISPVRTSVEVPWPFTEIEHQTYVLSGSEVNRAIDMNGDLEVDVLGNIYRIHVQDNNQFAPYLVDQGFHAYQGEVISTGHEVAITIVQEEITIKIDVGEEPETEWITIQPLDGNIHVGYRNNDYPETADDKYMGSVENDESLQADDIINLFLDDKVITKESEKKNRTTESSRTTYYNYNFVRVHLIYDYSVQYALNDILARLTAVNNELDDAEQGSTFTKLHVEEIIYWDHDYLWYEQSGVKMKCNTDTDSLIYDLRYNEFPDPQSNGRDLVIYFTDWIYEGLGTYMNCAVLRGHHMWVHYDEYEYTNAEMEFGILHALGHIYGTGNYNSDLANADYYQSWGVLECVIGTKYWTYMKNPLPDDRRWQYSNSDLCEDDDHASYVRSRTNAQTEYRSKEMQGYVTNSHNVRLSYWKLVYDKDILYGDYIWNARYKYCYVGSGSLVLEHLFFGIVDGGGISKDGYLGYNGSETTLSNGQCYYGHYLDGKGIMHDDTYHNEDWFGAGIYDGHAEWGSEDQFTFNFGQEGTWWFWPAYKIKNVGWGPWKWEAISLSVDY